MSGWTPINGTHKNPVKPQTINMSDREDNSAGVEETKDMSATDINFLVACLKNTTGGSVSINVAEVAKILNYKNSRSVSNKISEMKKKFNLPLSSSSASATKAAAEGASSAEPSISMTPSKNRVTKPRASAGKKGTARARKPSAKAAKEAKEVKEASGHEEEASPKSEKSEEEESLAVKDPKDMTDKEHEEAVFGKPDTDEEEEDTEVA